MSIISGNSFGVDSLSTTIRLSGDGIRVVGILLEYGELTGCCSMMPLGLMTPMGSITAGCCADISFMLYLSCGSDCA